MSKDFENAYDKVLNILYPGYSNLSDKRQELIRGRTWQIAQYASEVVELLPRMQEPKDPLYQEGASIKDICNIAAIYARICKTSETPIGYFSGEYTNKGYDSYGQPVGDQIYSAKSRTESEVLNQIKFEVEAYNSRPKISVKRLLESNCITKYNINYNTALEVNKVLKEMNSKEKVQDIKDVGMEREN